MKRTLLYAAILLGFLASPSLLSAQCTPGDETTCPDLENNGQICPEELPNAFVDEVYTQEFTILPPPQYVVDSAAGIVFELHHLTLRSIDNIPEGISWESNSEDSVFMVGTYYCVLLGGTPTTVGVYPLKIVVDVYLPGILGSPPIFAATVTDSTSLFINVKDPSGIPGHMSPNLSKLTYSPNPFNDRVTINYTQFEPDVVTFEVTNLLGKTMYTEAINSTAGENSIIYSGSELEAGIYLFSIRDEKGISTGRIIKSD